MAKQDLILLALDASPILDLMDRALRASDFEVAMVHNRPGLDKSVQESIPALMIIGEKFAGEDGLVISSEMLERFPTMPIILFVNQEANGVVKSIFKNGLAGYLCPPLKMQDIVDEVRRALIRARKLGDWVRREVKRTTASLEQKAKISEAERVKLEAIISNVQDGIIVLDESQHILLINQTIRDIFNLKDTPVIGYSLRDTVSNADLLALLDRTREGALKYHEINFDDGRVYNAQYTPLPRIGGAVTMQDISYLKEIDRLKNDFVHTVSHDLRSPLTAILGYTELIERTGELNDSQQEFLQRLQISVQHVTTLVNDLLDLGRLEAGFDTRREMVLLGNVLKYTLDVFDNQIKKKNIKLVSDVAPEVKPLRANPIRIRQMMDNLIGNAIKYTPMSGKVTVRIFMQENQIVMRVEDTGPGIPADEQNRVFDKFYRATNRPNGVEGTGLGLAIVKSIVESHQGRVWVESKVGLGSAFVVLLPAQE
ncbi:MAG TPA: ATP-binding protein [Anaerolineales bacterium]|nr:ATP-binding protein [Anaerolineales bacterium]HNB36205.1 ATP-binding protein [Anaerolineales bacterium]HNC07415.1 ATP-binding protein [Anaerolineales bacterium]